MKMHLVLRYSRWTQSPTLGHCEAVYQSFQLPTASKNHCGLDSDWLVSLNTFSQNPLILKIELFRSKYVSERDFPIISENCYCRLHDFSQLWNGMYFWPKNEHIFATYWPPNQTNTRIFQFRFMRIGKSNVHKSRAHICAHIRLSPHQPKPHAHL